MLIWIHVMVAVWCFAEFDKQVDEFQKSEHSSHVFETRLLSCHQYNVDGCLFINLLLTLNASEIYLVGNSFWNERGAYVIVSQEFKYYFVILLLEWNVIIIASDFVIEVIAVYFH